MKVPKARRLPSGLWFIQLRLGGQSLPVSAASERECVQQAQLLKAEYLAGKKELKVSSLGKLPTLGKAIDNYIAAREYALSPSTVRGYSEIRKLRFQGIMDVSISDITDAAFQVACRTEAKMVSARTLKNSWSFIKTVVKSETGRILPDVSIPQIVPSDTPFLDADQILAFIQEAKKSRYSIPIFLALHSLRRSEIMALRWENVDLEHRRFLVRGAAVMDKNNKLVQKEANKNATSTRYVPILIDELYDALKAAQQPEGLVVTCNPNTIWANIRRICAKMGLPPVGIHGLRHSFASLAYHLGTPEKITMEMGGWNDDRTMKKIYTHIAQKDVKRYEDRFSGFFKNANENANSR